MKLLAQTTLSQADKIIVKKYLLLFLFLIYTNNPGCWDSRHEHNWLTLCDHQGWKWSLRQGIWALLPPSAGPPPTGILGFHAVLFLRIQLQKFKIRGVPRSRKEGPLTAPSSISGSLGSTGSIRACHPQSYAPPTGRPGQSNGYAYTAKKIFSWK